MLNTQVVTLQVAGGAVPTNCIVAAYSVGDITDLKQALQRQLTVKDTYQPHQDRVMLYRELYKKRNIILKALNAGIATSI